MTKRPTLSGRPPDRPARESESRLDARRRRFEAMSGLAPLPDAARPAWRACEAMLRSNDDPRAGSTHGGDASGP